MFLYNKVQKHSTQKVCSEFICLEHSIKLEEHILLNILNFMQYQLFKETSKLNGFFIMIMGFVSRKQKHTHITVTYISHFAVIVSKLLPICVGYPFQGSVTSSLAFAAIRSEKSETLLFERKLFSYLIYLNNSPSIRLFSYGG